MRFLNVLSALLVMGCAVYISVHHTHDLYQTFAGFSSKYAWVAVLMAETMFIVGGLNISVARFRNYRPGWPSHLGFYLGLGLVGWANIASTAKYGLAGWLLGGSIVATVLIMELIMVRKTKAKKSPNQPVVETQPKQWSKNLMKIWSKLKDNQPATTNQPQKEESTNQQPQVDESSASQQLAEEVRPATRPDNKKEVVDQPEPEATIPPFIRSSMINSTNQPTNEADQETVNQPVVEEQPTTQPDEEVNQPDHQPVVESQPTKNNVIQFSTKRSAKRPESSTDLQTVMDVAKDYFDQHGKWPSQRKLAEMAGTTRHQAIRALDQLKGSIASASK